MRGLPVDLPEGVPARLGVFVVVLVVAAGGGWLAGQSVGPIRLPDPPAAQHGHSHHGEAR